LNGREKTKVPPKGLWQNSSTPDTTNTFAYKIHLHDTITLEQHEKQMATTTPSKSNDKMTKESTKKLPENQQKIIQ